MKFYYEGSLVRTSKTHRYTHAVRYNSEVVSCCSSYELAVKELNKRLARYDSAIRNEKAAIAAIERGERFYWAKEAGRSYKVKIEWTKDDYLGFIEENESKKKLLDIVALEARD